MKISIHRTFLKLLTASLKPARGVQIDGQNSCLPAYNETPVKYCIPPFYTRPHGKYDLPRGPRSTGNKRANIPDASEERDNRDSPEFYSNVSFHFLLRKASGGWRPVID